MKQAHLTIVGIGADGWSGLGERSRDAVLDAKLLIGSSRQLAMIPVFDVERRCWPSPIDSLVDALVEGSTGPACILASGDPMLHGIGSTLSRRVGATRLTVHPSPSALSYACARLAWPGAETELVSLVAHPVETLARQLQPGRRLIVYVHGEDGATEIVRMLQRYQLGPSSVTVLEQLGGDEEKISLATADCWEPRRFASPYLVAIDCRSDENATPLALVPGLPDSAYENDGQLTKREVRAITLSALAPLPGELLWDVGAGSGSIAIEWLRTEPLARAIAVEAQEARAARIERNARELGVPSLEVCCGHAPGALAALEQPDVVFIGGGLTTPTLVDQCWQRLTPGGRITANAVTLEGERSLLDACKSHGGTMVRIEIGRAEPIGSLTTWRPQLPVVQWTARKETR